jgi:hypothetical protein
VFFAAVLLVYLSRLLVTGEPAVSSADTLPTRYVPVSVLREGNFDLDEFPELRTGARLPYYLFAARGHVWSQFPVGGPLLLVPAYAVLQFVGVDVLGDTATRDWIGNALAALLSALSALVVYRTYAARGSGRALMIAGLYAFGTGVWPTCAVDLWQHTFGVLFFALCVLCLERAGDDDRWLAWMGLPAGLLFLVRPANGLLVAILAGAVLRRRPARLLPFALLGLPCLAFTLWYNLALLGHPFGAYGPEAGGLRPWSNLLEGLPGLLISPSRGLLIYSPVLLLGVFAVRPDLERLATLYRSWVTRQSDDPSCKDGKTQPPAALASHARFVCPTLALLAGVHLLTYSSYTQWYGGYCFGPRFLLEVMPALAGLLWHAWPRVTATHVGRFVLAAAAAWSVLANGSGYVLGWGVWCSTPDLGRCPGRLWDWRDNPLACAVWGLPEHCLHPLQRGTPHFDVSGVDFELGRGWSSERDDLVMVGREAELLVDCHGLPAGLVVLTMTGEKGIDQQEVTAYVEGEPRARAQLSSGLPQTMAVPVRPDERDRTLRLELHFSSSRRRSALDMRPLAGALRGVRVGFYGQ